MALDYLSPYDHAEDDYIDMEVSSFSTFLCHSRNSPPHPHPHPHPHSHPNPREFEFQMLSSTCLEREPTTSPADELFYKGKLLPLHLPPRLQMVEKLLQNTNLISPNYDHIRKLDDNTTTPLEEFYSTPLATNTATTPATSTPFESCSVSPSESCRVSRDLDPQDYMYAYNYSAELTSFINIHNPKKSWTKKLKHSALGSKLKASRAYLKSWFGVKSGCSEYDSAATKIIADGEEGSLSKPPKECSGSGAKKNPFGQIHRNEKYQTPTASASSVTNKERMNEDGGVGRHRRSFSVAIKLRHSTNQSSSSSFSSSSSSGSSSCSYNNNSIGVQELQFLKRCSSANSEIENPIQGAIAHCKESQQRLFRSRKTASEVGIYSLSSSRLGVCEDQERPELCRG